jgi:hypothetical protein
VVIYYQGEIGEGRATVVTGTRGALARLRVVRGCEGEWQQAEHRKPAG